MDVTTPVRDLFTSIRTSYGIITMPFSPEERVPYRIPQTRSRSSSLGSIYSGVVGNTKVTTVIGRRRSYGLEARPQARQDVERSAPISEPMRPRVLGLPARPRVDRSGKPPGADRRKFAPGAQPHPIFYSGSWASILPSKRSLGSLRMSLQSLPCVRRAARREVMFAQRMNKGHRRRKRRTIWSDLEC